MTVDQIHQVVFAYLDSLDCTGSRLYVGFSGGIDSKVLLLACQAYCVLRPGVSVEAVHINHQLHEDADNWADECANFCISRRLPYRMLTVDILESHKSSGLELRARHARYQAFRQVLSQDGSGILLLAHHAHDQWETIVMRMIQGTGLAGLLGMRSTCMHRGMMVVRPMLDISRQDCEDYLRATGLTGIIDSSNEDEVFTRGFIRKQLTPVVSSRWPHFAATVSKQSRIWAEDFTAMDACVQQVLVQVMMSYHGLPYVCVKKLQHYPVSVRLVLLKSWLRAQGHDIPNHSKLVDFIIQAQDARCNRYPHLIHGDTMLTIDRGRMFLLPIAARDMRFPAVVSRSHESKVLSNCVFTWSVCCPDNLQTSYRRQWDGITLANVSDVWCRSVKTKKKLLQSLRVPWFLRNFYPALLDGNTLVGVVGKVWSQDRCSLYAMLQIDIKVQSLSAE